MVTTLEEWREKRKKEEAKKQEEEILEDVNAKSKERRKKQREEQEILIEKQRLAEKEALEQQEQMVSQQINVSVKKPKPKQTDKKEAKGETPAIQDKFNQMKEQADKNEENKEKEKTGEIKCETKNGLEEEYTIKTGFLEAEYSTSIPDLNIEVTKGKSIKMDFGNGKVQEIKLDNKKRYEFHLDNGISRIVIHGNKMEVYRPGKQDLNIINLDHPGETQIKSVFSTKQVLREVNKKAKEAEKNQRKIVEAKEKQERDLKRQQKDLLNKENEQQINVEVNEPKQKEVVTHEVMMNTIDYIKRGLIKAGRSGDYDSPYLNSLKEKMPGLDDDDFDLMPSEADDDFDIRKESDGMR
jgi:hypothetical protein